MPNENTFVRFAIIPILDDWDSDRGIYHPCESLRQKLNIEYGDVCVTAKTKSLLFILFDA